MSTINPSTLGDSAKIDVQGETALRELRRRLTATRRNLLSNRLGICLASAFSIVAVCLAGIAVADFFFEIPFTWRAAWIGAVVLAISVIAAIVWKRWIASYTLSKTAVDAERRLSQFGQRLRTTLDYEQNDPQPATASPSLLHSLHAQTSKLARETEWTDAIDSRPLMATLFGAAAIAVAWISALTAFPEFRISAARALLIPREYTTVTFTPQTQTIRPGETVTVTAMIAGRPVASAHVRHRPMGSTAEWTTVDLLPETAESETEQTNPKQTLHGELTAILADFTEDTEFEVIAGPIPLPQGLIRVLQPLTLEKAHARVVPPAYTGRPENQTENLDLKVLEGSLVEFTLEFNRAAVDAKLTRSRDAKSSSNGDPQAENAVIPEIALHLDGNVATGTLPDLRKTVTWTLTAQTADGMALDPLNFQIRVQLDRKPEIKFLEPPEELVVTPTTEVPIVIEADDDLGLHKFGVMYQVASGPMQLLIEQDANGDVLHDRQATALLLEDHGLTHQDAVTYYAFAEDNYFGHPRRTTTPLRFIDIRPYKLSFQVVDQKGGSCNGCSVTLEELITRQRQYLSQAFQQGELPLSKEAMSRLSDSEEELQQAAYEFATGMTALGANLPSLDEAVNHMGKAIESLDAMDLTEAIVAEQQALAALVRARENVRKKLNQSSSSSASQCRQFDREQRQKLRMPEKKKSEQQKVADVRKKLEDLAKRERKWSQQAQQSCNNPSSSGKPGQKSSESSQNEPSQTAQSSPDANPAKSPSNEAADQKDGQQTDSPNSPAQADVAAEQEKLRAELAEIQKQIEKLNQAGQGAKEQARQADESMSQGLAELERQDGNGAAKEAERAAQQLEQLSDHLAAMNARDFGQRLDQAHQLAKQLAIQQESLQQKLDDGNNTSGKQGSASSHSESKGSSSRNESSVPTSAANGSTAPTGSQPVDAKSSAKTDERGLQQLARDQQSLAAKTGLLGDLLDRLSSDARREAGGVKQKLDQAQAENPPHEIAEGMSATADDLRDQHLAAARQGAQQSGERLKELSTSLGNARAEFAQPQLKELLALEEQLAQLQQQMKRAQGKSDEAHSMSQKWQQLESRLDKLGSADKRLAQALQQLRDGPQGRTPSADGQDGSQDEKTAQTQATTGGKIPLKPGTPITPSPNPKPESDSQVPEGFYSWLELGDFTGVRNVSKALQARIQEAILAAALMDADQPVPPAYKELVEKYYKALSDDLR